MMIETDKEPVSLRKQEIVQQYLHELDQHIGDLKAGKAEKTFEIKDLADLLHIHPRHLSNTIHEVLNQSPCDIYEQKLMNISKELILQTNLPIAQIARHLLYDPSNFTKFFKNYAGITPKKFREQQAKN